MNSAAFLLAIAAPAAATVAGGLASTTQAVGNAFSEVLGAVTGTESPVDTTSESTANPTLNESLESLATNLRNWLGDHGASGDYSIEYRLEADGESQVDVTGDAAEQVKQLLASKPSWLSELRQIAASWQAQTAKLSGTGFASSANIEISDVEQRLS